ncbi:uncharacterized protein LOC121262707 [Juglans microcarpa x Juglans regia]|uniref:uncharacterized protein LOC121262707 n=1 Tax=Juglans microcarpa x Juglans regia TaxID=2249226 RepID=UPI001B7F014A|nr:uncharacterized protein LOC121262707 [Juglans microcarpa x Juglans regia]
MFLCGMAIALLGSRCHAPSVMLANFIATRIELRYLCLPLLFNGMATIETPFIFQSLQLLGWLVVAAPFILATLYVILLPCRHYLTTLLGQHGCHIYLSASFKVVVVLVRPAVRIGSQLFS